MMRPQKGDAMFETPGRIIVICFAIGLIIGGLIKFIAS